MTDSTVSERAVRWIKGQFGGLADLSNEVKQVIWVTAYRACEIGLTMEAAGGPSAIAKSMLLGGGSDALELESSIHKLEFLKKIVPIIRAGNARERDADAQLLIDVLKWGIIDAADMSGARRLIARQFAKADPMYKLPLPAGLI